MQTIKPLRLNKGDTMGIISPSQAIDISAVAGTFEQGIKKIESWGYKVKVGKNARNKYFYSAGTPQERTDDLHQMFRDPEVKAILMSIGGDTANEVLPLLDFSLIKQHPKIIMGMSDGTTLLTPITDKTGLVTFYGPDLIYSFGLQKDAEVFEKQMFKCVSEGIAEFEPQQKLITDDEESLPNERKTVRVGSIQGQLIGGYLEIVNSLVATKYLNLDNFENAILYTESTESANIIHMRLQHMKMLGIFDKIVGLIIGYFPDIYKDKNYYREVGDIILELTKDKTFPILQVNELGHMIKNYTWPNGIKVKLNASSKTVKSLESCVE